MSQVLVIMRGLPASGKTTYARKWVAEDLANRVRVNRDDLRSMLHDGLFVKGVTEQTIIAMRDNMITTALRFGKSVINDDTNLPSRNVRDLMKLAAKYGAEVKVVDLTNVDFYTCLQRNAERGHTVPDTVIKEMWMRFGLEKVWASGKPLPLPDMAETAVERKMYVPDASLPFAVIFDIDGTLAHMNGRSPYDYTLVSTDLPDYRVIDELFLHAREGDHIIFLSGRKSECREDTVQWLLKYTGMTGTGVYSSLFMRADGDDRNDAIVKYELFDTHVRPNFNVLHVYDDRNRVVEMWRSIGLKCFQVATGDF